MIRIFSLYDLDVKEHCMNLLNQRASFIVRMVKDNDGNPHHWEVDAFNMEKVEGQDATG